MTKAIRKNANVGARIKLAEYAEKHRELEEMLIGYKQTANAVRERLEGRNRALLGVQAKLVEAHAARDDARSELAEVARMNDLLKLRISGLESAQKVAEAKTRAAWREYRDMRRLAKVLFGSTVAFAVATVTLLVL